MGNIKFTPLKLRFMNPFCLFSVKLFQLDKNLRRETRQIEGYASGKIKIFVYETKGLPKNAPCILYFHGGAFILEDFIFIHKNVTNYAASVPCKVVFVRYRLAPKYPFPIPVEDCYQSLLWVNAHADELGIDPSKIIVAGDSAGGNLAAALTHMTRDRHGPPIYFQMLIYPVTDQNQATESMKAFTDTPGWNSRLNRQMWNLYLKEGDKGMLNYASPLNAKSFLGLPSAYIETEEFDCLRDEGNLYAEKLKKNGIKVELNEMKGTFHGFDINSKSNIVKSAIQARIESLKRAIEGN